MPSQSSSIFLWSYGLLAVSYSLFAIHLLVRGYARRPAEPLKVIMLGAVVLTALWGWLTLALVWFEWPLLARLATLCDILRYGAWFSFVLTLLRANNNAQLPSGIAWLRPTALSLVSASVLVQGLSAVAGSFDSVRWALFCAMGLPVFALVLVEQLYRNASEDALWNLKPLCLGLAGAFLFDVYVFSQAVLFNRPDGDALQIRGAVHALMAPLLLLSCMRRNDWVARISVSRKAAFHSATLLIAGAYLLFISAVGYYVRYFGGEWGRALQLGLVFLGLVALTMLALSGSMRAHLRVLLGKHFFRYRYDYREEWLRFTRTLSSAQSPPELGLQVIRGLADMLESPGGALWLKRLDGSGYSQTERWNLPASAVTEAVDSPLCQFMREGGWVVNLEEFRSFPRRYGGLMLPLWLQEMPQAWLLVPLTSGTELIGFVLLASSRVRVEVNWEVNDLLKTAGRQAASFLAQMQATEALLEVRKFDAFNRMSAFVVHDLKNIVTQLSLMVKNAKRLSHNPEFQADMLLTVENSLERMRKLMLQLREGATPAGSAVGVGLGELVRRQSEVAAKRGRTVTVDVRNEVTTRGHAERVERIIGHLVQNALDATDPAGRVWIKLDRLGGQALVEVGDTGQGMSPEFLRDRLFKPFQTTKQAGMGIGAYESFQYVQELGGKIEVESELNVGTIVTLLLPLIETSKESDLHRLEDE